MECNIAIIPNKSPPSDVDVQVGGRVVQIPVERARIRPVIPIRAKQRQRAF